MPVPTHFRFSVRGTFKGTSEIWQYGFHFQRTVAAGQDAEVDNIGEAGVTAALTQFHGGSIFTSKAEFREWRAYHVGEDNKIRGNPKIKELDNPVVGSVDAWRYPPQISLVVSTIATNRGAAQRGRFYLPCPGMPMSSVDGRISKADAQIVIENTVTMLKSVSDAIDLPGTLVSSAMLNVSEGPPGSSTGTFQAVDHLEVGRALDQVSTRRNAILEEREVGGNIDW